MTGSIDRPNDLERRLRENDEMLATIAHDLRTPLNTMNTPGRLRAEGLETFFVRSVLEVHRGALRAEGATFVVTLPLAETFASI